MGLHTEEAPLPRNLSRSTLISAAPLALWKSPFLAMPRKIIRERTGQGGSSSEFKGWRTSLTSRSYSVTTHIYSRRRKDWRLFLSNLLIKSCQSCPNADRFMALDIKGRKYPVIKFMGLDRKPNWNSFANPRGKMIHLLRVGKSIFITFILPTPHFQPLPELLWFPSRCRLNQISPESDPSHWNLPAWLIQQPGKKGFVLHCVGGDLQRLRASAAAWNPRSLLRGVSHTLRPAFFLCRCVECCGWL